MRDYKYTSLKFVEKNIPEMKQRGVSERARSKGQFIDQFKKAKGNPKNLPEFWQKKRNSFVARTSESERLHKAKGHNTERQKLSLIAWAYKPE
jgi:hypothetical protein